MKVKVLTLKKNGARYATIIALGIIMLLSILAGTVFSGAKNSIVASGSEAATGAEKIYEYIITDSSQGYSAVGMYDDDSTYTVGNAGIDLNLTVDAIKADADGEDCLISFGDGDTIYVDTSIGFDGGTDGTEWGVITLTGKVTSNVGGNTEIDTGTIFLTNGVTIISYADIENTSTLNSSAIFHNSTGSVSIIGGTVSTVDSNCAAIYSVNTGKLTISESDSNTTLITSQNNAGGTVHIVASGTSDDTRLEIAGGTVENTLSETALLSVAIQNDSTGAITISGGEVLADENNTGYAIYNLGTGSVNISGGHVKGSYVGIWNEYNGAINISGGKLECEDKYAIYNNSWGKITVSEVSSDAPTLITSQNEDFSSGTIHLANFGSGEHTVLEITGGVVENSSDGFSCNAIYNDSVGTIVVSGGIVSSGAMTIFNMNSGNIDVSGGVISNVNGYAVFNLSTGNVSISGGTVSSEHGIAIFNSSTGKVAISEASSSKPTLITSATPNANATIVLSGGSSSDTVLEVTGGTVENTYNGISRAISNEAAGLVAVSGGEVVALKGYAIFNSSTGVINVSGGEVFSDSFYAVYNNKAGIVNITGGELRSNGNVTVFNVSTGVINVSGGEVFSGSSYAVYNNVAGIVNITGGELKSNKSAAVINVTSGEINISGGEVFSDESFALWNHSTGVVNISGGEVKANVCTTVTNASSGKINIFGDASIVAGSAGYAVNNSGVGEIKIYGGTMTASSIGMAVANSSTGKIKLGGNPTIDGSIAVSAETLSIINTDSDDKFAPQIGRVFGIRMPDSATVDDIAVIGGKDFAGNFVMVNDGYALIESGDDLVVATAYAVTVPSTQTNYSITNNASKAVHETAYTFTVTPSAGYEVVVNYTVDGGSSQSLTATSENSYAIPAESVTGAIVISVVANLKSYAVSGVIDGAGYSVSNNASSIEHGGNYTFTVTATTGYDVSTLSVAATGTHGVIIINEANGLVTIPNVTSAITVTISIDKLTYTISFDSCGGSAIGNIADVKHGDNIAKPSLNPTKSGYDFDGWFKEAAGTNAWDFDADTVTQSLTLYAKWSATDILFSTESELSGGAYGTADYSATVTAECKTDGTISYAVTSGNLPDGLILNAATGIISGTPSAAGTFTFTITATSSESGATASKEFVIVIAKVEVSVSAPTYSGGTLTYGDDFPAISGATSGGTYSFDAEQALVAGTINYNWTFTPVDIDNYTYTGLTGTISLTVEKGSQNAPLLSASNRTQSSITLTAVSGAEYSKDGTTWVDSNIFGGLMPSTQCTFYIRMKETDNLNASPYTTLQFSTKGIVTGKIDDDAPSDILDGLDEIFKDYELGEDLPAPTVPDGFTFVGWKDKDGNIVKSIDNLDESATLTAVVGLDNPSVTIRVEASGNKRTLTAEHEAHSGIIYTYQWYVKNDTTGGNKRTSSTNEWTLIADSISKTLTVTDSGEYRCEITATAGNLRSVGSNVYAVEIPVANEPIIGGTMNLTWLIVLLAVIIVIEGGFAALCYYLTQKNKKCNEKICSIAAIPIMLAVASGMGGFVVVLIEIAIIIGLAIWIALMFNNNPYLPKLLKEVVGQVGQQVKSTTEWLVGKFKKSQANDKAQDDAFEEEEACEDESLDEESKVLEATIANEEFSDEELAEIAIEDINEDEETDEQEKEIEDGEERDAELGGIVIDESTKQLLAEAEKEREIFIAAKKAGKTAPIPELRFTLSREDAIDYVDDMARCEGFSVSPKVILKSKKHYCDTLRCGEWCFALMYERNDVVKFTLRLDDAYADEISNKYTAFGRAAFPKGENWYDLVVDSSFGSKKEVFDILNECYAFVLARYYREENKKYITDLEAAKADAVQVVTEVAQNAAKADPKLELAILEREEALEKFRQKHKITFKMTRKRMLMYAKSNKGLSLNSIVVERKKVHLPASLKTHNKTYALIYDKIYKEKGEGDVEIIKAYVSLTVRISDAYAEWLMLRHPEVRRARFPKNRNWYIVPIDGSFPNAQMVYRILKRAKKFVSQ